MKLADMTIGTEVAWKTSWRGAREKLKVTNFTEVTTGNRWNPRTERRVTVEVIEGRTVGKVYEDERPAAFVPWAVRQAEIDHADARKQRGKEQVELATKALDRLGVPAQVFPARNGVTVHLNPDAVHELARAALLTD